MTIIEYIDEIEQQQKEFDAIYHSVAVKYGLSDTAMWVMYLLFTSEREWTQQDLCRQCVCAKQTINTAITKLVKNGYVKLEILPGTRNQKKIILTEQGISFAKQTALPLREVEIRAYKKLTKKELETYLHVNAKLIKELKEETDKL